MRIELPSGFRISVSPRLLGRVPTGTDLLIDTGGVFHPRHVTTRLCLDLLDRTVPRHRRGRLLDVGCGSGILALAAACLGVPRVVGLDLSLRAVRLSAENARKNRLSDRTLWVAGSLEAIGCCFDCIVANLPAPVLMDLLDEIRARLSPGGQLIVSGFQDVDWHRLAGRLDACRVRVCERIAGDQAHFDVPPSGSFTWLAVSAACAARGGTAPGGG